MKDQSWRDLLYAEEAAELDRIEAELKRINGDKAEYSAKKRVIYLRALQRRDRPSPEVRMRIRSET